MCAVPFISRSSKRGRREDIISRGIWYRQETKKKRKRERDRETNQNKMRGEEVESERQTAEENECVLENN